MSYNNSKRIILEQKDVDKYCDFYQKQCLQGIIYTINKGKENDKDITK